MVEEYQVRVGRHTELVEDTGIGEEEACSKAIEQVRSRLNSPSSDFFPVLVLGKQVREED